MGAFRTVAGEKRWPHAADVTAVFRVALDGSGISLDEEPGREAPGTEAWVGDQLRRRALHLAAPGWDHLAPGDRRLQEAVSARLLREL